MSSLLNEAAEADAWLEDYLSSDAELAGMVNGVFSTYIGTEKTSMPIVRFFLVEQNDLLTIGPNRVWSELVFQVEVVTHGPPPDADSTEARAIATRIDNLLHDLRTQVSSTLMIQECFRRQPLFRKGVEGGNGYIYAGGEYVFRVSAL